MQVFPSLDSIAESPFVQGSVIAIGKFDGVHLGHQQLLAHAVAYAEQTHMSPIVVTFANNPLSFLRPDLCPEPIMSRLQRIEALGSSQTQACVMLPFDAELAQITAEEFVEEILVNRLNMKHLVVGADFRFGHRGMGDVQLLKDLATQCGFTVEVLLDVEDPVLGKVSSSRIREAILQGDVTGAVRMLGRPVPLRGTVVHGDARGRELGFPTANVGGSLEGLRPADGVYAGWATIAGERFAAAISVGANVTFDPGGEPRVEAYLLDYSGDLYGQEIELGFVARIRGMEKFDGITALVEQMNADVQHTRELLGEANSSTSIS